MPVHDIQVGPGTPVLLIVFNRPDTTKRVFDAIRLAKPPTLYVAADGPREEKLGEDEKCNEARKIATNVDWPCTLHTLLQKKNMGCRRAVSSAITWFFQQEEEGIILEDDCLPSASFFPFCRELLERYRDDSRIMQIAGANFQEGAQRTSYSYYFSRYNHVWGWASWRRAWNYYDSDMKKWADARRDSVVAKAGNGNPSFVRYWTNLFDKVAQGRIDTWDYIWTMSIWGQSGLVVLPEVNLVENIGFGPGATHTDKALKNDISAPPASTIDFPLRHPYFIMRDVEADRHTERRHYKIKGFFALYAWRALRAPGLFLRLMRTRLTLAKR